MRNFSDLNPTSWAASVTSWVASVTSWVASVAQLVVTSGLESRSWIRVPPEQLFFPMKIEKKTSQARCLACF